MAFRSQISVILAIAMIAATLVLLWQSRQPAVYQSTALLAVEASPASVATAGGRPENIVFLARTYAARARTRPVVADAIKRSQLSEDVDAVLERTTIDVSNSDATITVTGSGGTARQARQLTIAMTNALRRNVRRDQIALREARVAPLQTRIQRLERQLGRLARDEPQRFAAQQEYQGLITARAQEQLRPLDRLQVLSPATAPAGPVSPQPVRASLLAALIALVIGVETVVAVRLLRGRRSATAEPQAAVPAG